MKPLALIATLALLAACGADGEPERPEKGEEVGFLGLKVSGTAEVGISRGNP
jgi:hypothetical protein